MRISDWSSDVCSSDLVALLAERGCGRGAGEAGADDDDLELAPVVGRHALHVELVLRPLVGDVAGRDVAVQLTDHQWSASSYSVQLTITSPSLPQSTLSSASTMPVSTDTRKMMRSEEQPSELPSLMRKSYAD